MVSVLRRLSLIHRARSVKNEISGQRKPQTFQTISEPTRQSRQKASPPDYAASASSVTLSYVDDVDSASCTRHYTKLGSRSSGNAVLLTTREDAGNCRNSWNSRS